MTDLDKFIHLLCVYIQEFLYVSGFRGYIHNCDTAIYNMYRSELNAIVVYSIIMVKMQRNAVTVAICLCVLLVAHR